MDQHIKSFEEIVGQGYVLIGSDTAKYEEDWRYENGKAACVVRPADASQISEIVKYCAAHQVKIIPQGANTGLVGASVPDQSGEQVVLTLERLNKSIEIDPVNKTAKVDAGVLLSSLNSKLEDHELYFPIDLGADPSIGGMVATNTGGSRLVRYGDVRHNVLGLEVVDGRGQVIDLLKDLRKDNTGLDLKQVFIGTGGSFGIVTRAVVSLAPLPKQRASVLVVPRSAEDINTILLETEGTFGSLLSAFEGMSRNAMRCAIENVPNTPDPFQGDLPDYALLIELSSLQDEEIVGLEGQLIDFVMMHYDEGGGRPIKGAVTGRSEGLWALRHSISEGLRHEGKVTGLDISLSRSQFWPFKAKAKAVLAEKYPYVMLCDFGHYGDGSDHFNLVWNNKNMSYGAEKEEEIRSVVYEVLVSEFGGSFSAEHGVGPANQTFYRKYKSDDFKQLCDQFKKMFDPADIFGNIRLGS